MHKNIILQKNYCVLKAMIVISKWNICVCWNDLQYNHMKPHRKMGKTTIDIIHTSHPYLYSHIISKGAFHFLVLLAYWKSAPSFTLIQTCKLSPDLNFSFPKCLLVLIQNQFNSRQFFYL